jgi:cell wall-associated NlpC family hydrolase
MQATMGQAVSRTELQFGDLVYFYSPVSHIGIYIGGGQMVHASTFGEPVKVGSVDTVRLRGGSADRLMEAAAGRREGLFASALRILARTYYRA